MLGESALEYNGDVRTLHPGGVTILKSNAQIHPTPKGDYRAYSLMLSILSDLPFSSCTQARDRGLVKPAGLLVPASGATSPSPQPLSSPSSSSLASSSSLSQRPYRCSRCHEDPFPPDPVHHRCTGCTEPRMRPNNLSRSCSSLVKSRLD